MWRFFSFGIGLLLSCVVVGNDAENDAENKVENKAENNSHSINWLDVMQGHWLVVEVRVHGAENYEQIETNWRGARQEYMIIGRRINSTEFWPNGHAIVNWGGTIHSVVNNRVNIIIDYYMPYEARYPAYAKNGQGTIISGKTLVGGAHLLDVRLKGDLLYLSGDIVQKHAGAMVRPMWFDQGLRRIEPNADSVE